MNGAATLVAEDQEERCTELSRGVLDASHDLRRHHVSRDANDEKLTEPGIENDFGGDARVAAAEDGRVRPLRGGEIRQRLEAELGVSRLSAQESLVAFGQAPERFRGRKRRAFVHVRHRNPGTPLARGLQTSLPAPVTTQPPSTPPGSIGPTSSPTSLSTGALSLAFMALTREPFFPERKNRSGGMGRLWIL